MPPLLFLEAQGVQIRHVALVVNSSVGVDMGICPTFSILRGNYKPSANPVQWAELTQVRGLRR